MTTIRSLHIQVYTDSIVKANINLPLNLLRTATKFPVLALNLVPKEVREELQKSGINLQDINMGELLRMVEQGQIKEKLVDMEVLDPVDGRIYVKIYIDKTN
ncbi:MAG: hypothetical protein AAGU27_18315 [Dehalobacterium sp.]